MHSARRPGYASKIIHRTSIKFCWKTYAGNFEVDWASKFKNLKILYVYVLYYPLHIWRKWQKYLLYYLFFYFKISIGNIHTNASLGIFFASTMHLLSRWQTIIAHHWHHVLLSQIIIMSYKIAFATLPGDFLAIFPFAWKRPIAIFSL